MAEFSWIYGCTVGGDATALSQELLAETFKTLAMTDPTTQGVIYTKEAAYSGLLSPTFGGANIVNIDTGRGVVNGYLYRNNAIVPFDVSGGNANATDLIVLRSTPGTGLVRLALVRGNPVATVTQNAATWEIPIARVQLDGVGNFSSLSDARSLAATTGNMVLLDTYVGDGTNGVATFSGIPQLFSQLRIEGATRSDSVIALDPLDLTINNDAGANYEYLIITSSGSGVSDALTTGANNISLGASGTVSTADMMTKFVIEVPDYKSTDFPNGLMGKSVYRRSALYAVTDISATYLPNTSVTRLDFVLNLGNFTVGTNIKLYGIA